MTKSKIKADYIVNLRSLYAGKVDYSDGTRPWGLACNAADQALAGKIKLEGEAWFMALASNGVQKAATRAMLAALPE